MSSFETEPSVSYDAEYFVLLYRPNEPEGARGARMPLSQLLPVGYVVPPHTHEGDNLEPNRIIADSINFTIQSVSGGNIRLRHIDGVCDLFVYSNNILFKLNGATAFRVIDGLASFHGIQGSPLYYGITAPNASPSGKFQAYAYDTYACTLDSKTDIAEITDATEKLKSVRGLTYVQNGLPSAGSVVEELATTGIPGIVTKDKDGNYIGKNETLLIPVLLQAIRELTLRVESLEAAISK